MPLKNRFAPLLQDLGSLTDDREILSPVQKSVSSESKSDERRLQGEKKNGPYNLFVCDSAVKDMTGIYSKNIKVLCFPSDMVCDLTDRVQSIVAVNPTV